MLAAALLAAPLSLAVTLTRSSDGPSTAATTAGTYDQRLISRRSGATEVATQAVSTWLTATNDNSSDFARLGWDPAQLKLPDKAPSVTDLSVFDAQPTGPGVWLVEVGATVTPATGGDPTRRYFTVPVGVAGATQIAAKPLALPAEVPAPSTTVPGVETQYGTQITPGSPAFSTTSGFLTSLLTGQGDLSLYLRPGTAISNITPAPWSGVTVSSVQTDDKGAPYAGRAAPDGTQMNITTQADATPVAPPVTPPAPAAAGKTPTPAAPPTDSGRLTTPLQYQLTLTARGGRWEVSAVSANPTTNTTDATPTP